MPTLRNSVVIDRPIEDVFDHVVAEGVPQGAPGTWSGSDPAGWTKCVRPSLLEFNGEAADPQMRLRMRLRMTFEPIVGGTRMTSQTDLSAGGFFGLFLPVFMFFARRPTERQMQVELEALRRSLEDPATGAARRSSSTPESSAR